MSKARLYGPPNGRRVQGTLTADGTRIYVKVCEAVAEWSGLDRPSDADVIEYLARAWQERSRRTAARKD